MHSRVFLWVHLPGMPLVVGVAKLDDIPKMRSCKHGLADKYQIDLMFMDPVYRSDRFTKTANDAFRTCSSIVSDGKRCTLRLTALDKCTSNRLMHRKQ